MASSDLSTHHRESLQILLAEDVVGVRPSKMHRENSRCGPNRALCSLLSALCSLLSALCSLLSVRQLVRDLKRKALQGDSISMMTRRDREDKVERMVTVGGNRKK